MKSSLLFVLLFSFFTTVGQVNSNHPDSDEVADTVEAEYLYPQSYIFRPHNVDKKAEFQGGEDSLRYFINKHVEYPKEAIEKGLYETIQYNFVVNQDGTVTNIRPAFRVEYHPFALKAEEVIQKTSGMWMPAEKDGRKVRMHCTTTVSFYKLR